MTNQAVTPVGLNHLVLNVRNIEESHRFWTEIVGFKQVGEIHASPTRPTRRRCASTAAITAAVRCPTTTSP